MEEKKAEGALEITEHASLGLALLHAMAEYPPLEKNTTVNVTMKSGGSYSYEYADLAYTKRMTDPYLWKHGLVVNGKTEYRDGKEFQVDTLRHVHSDEKDTSEIEVTESDMKQFGGNSTYAKRYNYCNLAGRVGEDDSEPRPAGSRNRSQKQQDAPNKPSTGNEQGASTGSASAGEGKPSGSDTEKARRACMMREAEVLGVLKKADRPSTIHALRTMLLGEGKAKIEDNPEAWDFYKALLDVEGNWYGSDNPPGPGEPG